MEISINNCVHYCGFLYGHDDYNPYQTYIKNMHNGIPKHECRKKFIDFLKHYRPENMAQALGITLSTNVPLWVYPWNRCGQGLFSKKTAWFNNPIDCPDILTHFSEKGILEFRIEEEFVWLEKAYYSIKTDGYDPKKYSSYVNLLRLIKSDGSISYLVLDGNHRISALNATGKQKIDAVIQSTVLEKDSKKWYCVRKSFIPEDDALKIFNSYFLGNINYKTTEKEAQIIS